MSKFATNFRFSDKDSCVNEHEVFEMMRSRKLYQIQFDLRQKLQKRIRAIELDAKVNASTFQMKKIFFLNKMQEKVRLRNAVAEKYTKMKQEQNQVAKIYEKSVSDERPETSMQLLETVIPEGGIPTSIQHNRSHADETTSSKTEEELFARRKNSVDMDIPDMIRSKTAFSLGGLLQEANRGSQKQRRLKSETSVHLLQNKPKLTPIEKKMHHKLNPIDNVPRGHKQKQTKKTVVRKTIFSGAPCAMENEEFRERRSLASYEIGSTTPGGKLLLFKEDHDRFLDKFRQKKERQIIHSRRRSEQLDQKIKAFSHVKRTFEIE